MTTIYRARTTDGRMDQETPSGNRNQNSENSTSENRLGSISNLSADQIKQLGREREQREQFKQTRQAKVTENQQKGRGSQTDGGRGIRYHLVPSVADWLQRHDNYVALRGHHAGFAMREYRRIKTWIDPYTISHLAVTVILDCLGRGSSMKTKIPTVQVRIGKYLEDQAMMAFMNDSDPLYFAKLSEYYLNDPVRRYDKKISGMRRAVNLAEQFNWEYMDEQGHLVLGSLLLHAVMSIQVNPENGEGLFESRCASESDKRVRKKKKNHKPPRYLAFTQTGLYYRDKIQAAADEMSWKPEPMICKPLPWSLKTDA